MAETFEEIGTSTDWWFWALKPFKGKLYAGTYKEGAPKIYNYPTWQLQKTFSGNGTAGESVLRLVEFDDEFYCASECIGDEGHIYRMTTADPTEWTSVHHEGTDYYPKPLIVFKGYLYAGWFEPIEPDRDHGNIKILRSPDGDSWSPCANWTGKSLLSFVIYNNELYIISKSDITGLSWGARTSTGTDWEDVLKLCGRDYGWSHGVVFNGKLYLGQDGKSIYRYDGTNLDKVLEVNVDIDLTQDLGGLVFDGKIYFLFAQSWKAESGNVYLYRSDTGNLNDWGAPDLYGAPFHTFTNYQNGACMAEFDGHLYLGVGGPLVGSVVYQKSSPIPVAPSNCVAHFSSPDKSYCTWQDKSDNETGFRVECLDGPVWSWPPTKDMGGVLSLNILPTLGEWQYCGFDFHILFGEGDYSYTDFIAATGAKVFAFCNEGNYEAWTDESHVVGYFLRDDTPYDVATVQAWYNKMKAKTSKPVGSIFWRPPNDTDRNRLITMSNFLDFILVYDYPYVEGRSLEDINARIAYMIALEEDLNCPVLIGAQAFGDIAGFEEYIDPQEVGVKNQYDQYYAAGIPIWWYSWTNEDADVKRNHQDTMNEFYHKWRFFENKGVNATQSSLKDFTIGDNVKWRVRAYNVAGVSAWATSDYVYIGGGGPGKVWTTKADFESGVLTDVLVPEGFHKLELKRLALSGTGVWVLDGGPGRKFNWHSFEHNNPSQNVFYRDDFRDNSLEAWTIVGGTWEAVNQSIKGSGNLSWQTNRIRVGSTSWQGVDILCKASLSGEGLAHLFYLRADSQGYNVNSYGLTTCLEYTSRFRVANGEVLEDIQLLDYGCPVATWHWIRVQIYTEGSDVKARIKWWLLDEDEPGWEVSTTWTGIWRGSGCFCLGRHTTSVIGYYDNVLISRKEGIPSPANCSVSFKFWASSNAVSWGNEYTDIAKVPNSRFIKIEATLSRTSLLSAMPTLEDMTLTYRLAVQPIFI